MDLCSGLGGASEAFIRDDKWHVIRVENNPLLQAVPFTLQCDVLNWMDWIDTLPTIDVIWASPPCTEFSLAYNSPKSLAARAGLEHEPDMSILLACLDIIDYLKPKSWVVENVAGAIKKFDKMMGHYRQHISSFFLWGVFPQIIVNTTHKKTDINPGGSDPLRSNKRAKIPFEVSLAFLRALEEQKKVSDYL